ncbi:arsenite resistance protein Ars2 [Phlyctema vagabunda]|uniref:Arsenite resistance protein Ars2 n=1 Tax=Phlyctema vagabunda TaxID=108571 RepID=A0ABR4PWJ7_9HELO
MDAYPAYREPAPARSPVERSNWGGRDESRRSVDKSDRSDTFYRGRSPGGDRSRRARESRDRSRSPLVDRYEPSGRGARDDYGRPDRGDREERRRRPSPGPSNIDRYVPGQDNAPITVNPLQDPSLLPFQVGFSYFGEWWRTNEKIKAEREYKRTGKRSELRGRNESQDDRDKEKIQIQAAYDVYKEELQAKMARAFVQEHKGEQWFQERYVAEVRVPLREQLNEFRRGNYTQWEQDLEAGTFDEYSLEGIPKSESNGSGGIIEKEEGETTAANEVLGVGDLVPSRGSDIRDENAFQPTLLIKTIAPHVSRQNLENFCKEHLGEDEGGFKWLSLSDPNPSKRYHRIGWVMLHPTADTAGIVDRPEIKDEDAPEAVAPPILTTAEKALEAVNGKTVKDEARGDFTCHVGVHVPPSLPRKKALWDLFSAPERIDKDLELAQRLIGKYEEDYGSDFNAVLKIEERVEDLKNQGRLQPPVTSPVTKKAKKTRDPLGLDEALDEGEEGEEVEEDEEEEEGAVDDEVDDEELLLKKKQLDLMVEYLRRVFNFCFFCVFESDSIHELTRKCPGGHLRRPRNTLTSAGKAAARASAAGEPLPGKKRMDEDTDMAGSPEGERKFRNSAASKAEQQLQRAFNWVKTFEEKILQILEPDSIDVRKLGGKSIEQALEEELPKFVKQEDEHKFRCRIPECQKLFKEEHFWKKHVEKRHPEWLDSLKKDFELINTYVTDPAHIAPSRSDANSNGHFPQANGGQPAGTPRGFNLNNMFPGMPGLPGFGQTGNFPFFAGAVQTPPGWGAGLDSRGAGPVRRGGRQYQSNARTGPYDRRPTDQRWGREAGRLSPPGGRRGGSMGGGGKWGDGAAGAAAVGPREAVQGRSLRSYEDLDAVAGGGSGELNY